MSDLGFGFCVLGLRPARTLLRGEGHHTAVKQGTTTLRPALVAKGCGKKGKEQGKEAGKDRGKEGDFCRRRRGERKEGKGMMSAGCLGNPAICAIYT